MFTLKDVYLLKHKVLNTLIRLVREIIFLTSPKPKTRAEFLFLKHQVLEKENYTREYFDLGLFLMMILPCVLLIEATTFLTIANSFGSLKEVLLARRKVRYYNTLLETRKEELLKNEYIRVVGKWEEFPVLVAEPIYKKKLGQTLMFLRPHPRQKRSILVHSKQNRSTGTHNCSAILFRRTKCFKLS